MKRITGLIVATALACASCSKLTTAEKETARTPAPELAPEGVFYLVAFAQVKDARGMHNLPPGTGVKRVREGVYLTPFGEQRLDAALLTNDMAKARAARDADRVAQELLKARQAVAAATTPAPAATPTPRYLEGVNTQSVASKPAAPSARGTPRSTAACSGRRARTADIGFPSNTLETEARNTFRRRSP